jgi:hypothetical protein
MINTSKDMALEALLNAAHQEAPNIPSELIKAIYQVEKFYQFNPEDKSAIDALQKLIDEELNNFHQGGNQ